MQLKLTLRSRKVFDLRESYTKLKAKQMSLMNAE